MITNRWRIMVVVLRSPASAAHLPSGEVAGVPPREPATFAAQLIGWGAEVRILDQDAELMSDRTVRREVTLWRADLVMFWMGGSFIADVPVPDTSSLESCLAGWDATCPLVACGPLGKHHGPEMLAKFEQLTAVLPGGFTESLAQRWDPADHPGTFIRGGVTPGTPPGFPRDVLPAWHLLNLESYGSDAPGGQRRIEILAGDSPATALRQCGHAVRRGGARFLIFADRDLGADPEMLEALTRGMIREVPAVPWACRVRADRLAPAMSLQLLRGACVEVFVSSPSEPSSPGLPPMDDPLRSRIESAVEAVRATGMSAIVEHVIGRPGHTRDVLAAWWRWFSDRRMVVRPSVRIVQHGEDGAAPTNLAEALDLAGCCNNDLDAKDIGRAIRAVTNRNPAGAMA